MSMMRWRSLSVLLASLCLLASGAQFLAAQEESADAAGPVNLGFEQDARGWGGGGQGYLLEIDRQVARTGEASGRIRFEGEQAAFGSWTQVVSAQAFRGKIVRYTGHVRTERVKQGAAALWMRVDGEEEVLAFDNMAGRGLSGTADWTACRIELFVPQQAQWLAFGMLLAGEGTAWVDDLSVTAAENELLDSYAASTEPLEEQALQNLEALARLWGLVRFFYPALQDSKADWEQTLLAAVPRFEQTEELLPALLQLVEPFGGTIRINHRPPEPPSPWQEVLESQLLYLIPGGSLPDLSRVKAVVLDLRGGAPFPEALLARLLGKPALYPDTRTVRHFGYSGGEPNQLYRTRLMTVRGKKVQPDGEREPLGVMILTDSGTSPLAAGPILALVDSGQGRLVGTSVAGWPEAPYEVELAEGIRLWMPLATYSEPIHAHFPCASAGALETALAALRGEVEPSAAGSDQDGESGDEPPFLSVRMRQVRLADVIILWNVLKYFYPYWEVVDTDWPAALPEFLARAAECAAPADFQRTMRQLLALARDGHGYLGVAEAGDPHAAPGLALAWVEDRIVIATADEAARAAGLEPGMELVEVDGRNARELLQERLLEASGATLQFRRIRALGGLLAGKPGSEAVLGVRHAGGEIRRVRAARDRGAGELSDLPDRPTHELLEGEVLYINLDRIDDAGFRELLGEATRARGLIFELRGYPSRVSTLPLQHIIDEAIQSAHMNVPIITHPDRSTIQWQSGGWPVVPAAPRIPRQVKFLWPMAWLQPRLFGPVVFLCDGRAISYAETYLALVKQNRVAVIMGEPTAGTNGNITSGTLPGGVSFVFTGMRVYNIDDSVHHGVGVLPDLEVHRTIEGVRAGRDEFVEAALEWITGQDEEK